jgi:hypothetical protein
VIDCARDMLGVGNRLRKCWRQDAPSAKKQPVSEFANDCSCRVPITDRRYVLDADSHLATVYIQSARTTSMLYSSLWNRKHTESMQKTALKY